MNFRDLEFHRGMFAPRSYWEATPKARAEACNGCGAKGALIDFVPDQLVGMDIEEECNVHDWMYTLGETEGDKRLADLVFLINILLKCYDSPAGLRLLRRRLGFDFYLAVAELGRMAFWSGKQGAQ